MDGNDVKEKPADTGALQENEEPGLEVQKVKKQFFIVAAVAGVLIVGLIASIIVVAVNKGNKAVLEPVKVPEESAEESSDTEAKEGYILTDAELNDAYSADASEISNMILAASESGAGFGGILDMYQEKINAAEDVRLKAMLESDYYYLKFSMSPTEDLKNEILNALMRIDGVLETSASAYNVVNIASYYNEQEIVNYYTNLAMERNTVEPDSVEDTGEELEGVG